MKSQIPFLLSLLGRMGAAFFGTWAFMRVLTVGIDEFTLWCTVMAVLMWWLNREMHFWRNSGPPQ